MKRKPFNWVCPYCKNQTTISEPNCSSGLHQIHLDSIQGKVCIFTKAISCPNPECKELSLSAFLYKLVDDYGHYHPDANHQLAWQLKPQSISQQYPDYVPQAIREDYLEACIIKDLSPKASATLSRRCIQGIIRDFFEVKGKKNLYQEIDAIRDRIDPLTWQAIDSVRSIGNIGAHMERDIDLIIDVDPDEAAMLIGLIEIMIKDCYISRHERELQLKSIIEVAKKKKEIKEASEQM